MAEVIGRTHSLSLAQDSEANRLRIYFMNGDRLMEAEVPMDAAAEWLLRRMQDDGIPVTIKQVK